MRKRKIEQEARRIETYPAQRKCKTCGATISIYNPSEVCFCHSSSDDEEIFSPSLLPRKIGICGKCEEKKFIFSRGLCYFCMHGWHRRQADVKLQKAKEETMNSNNGGDGFGQELPQTTTAVIRKAAAWFIENATLEEVAESLFAASLKECFNDEALAEQTIQGQKLSAAALIRHAAKVLVEHGELEAVADFLPVAVLQNFLANANIGGVEPMPVTEPAISMLKTHTLTKDEVAVVQKRLGSLDMKSEKYKKTRDEFCRQFDITRRQIASVIASPHRSRQKTEPASFKE